MGEYNKPESIGLAMQIQHQLLFVFFDYSAWISNCNYIVGYIFCYNTACANYNIIPDRNAGQDNGSAANPDIVTDNNRRRSGFAKLKRAIRFRFSKTLYGICRMKCRINLYIGCN